MREIIRTSAALLLCAAGASTQIVTYKAFPMTGAQVAPAPVTTPTTGTCVVTLNTVTRELSWAPTVQNIVNNLISSHFHGPANPGANAAETVVLTMFGGTPNNGTATLTAQQVTDLQAGKWYLDVHTMAFPGGLIRGQVVPTVQNWVDIGGAKLGSGFKSPVLRGDGPLAANSANSLALSDAKANANAILFVGLTAGNAPFKGGTLVPTPTFMIPLQTDVQGRWTLAFNWPAGVPALTNAYWQVWVKDPGATQGASASNALRSSAG